MHDNAAAHRGSFPWSQTIAFFRSVCTAVRQVAVVCEEQKKVACAKAVAAAPNSTQAGIKDMCIWVRTMGLATR